MRVKSVAITALFVGILSYSPAGFAQLTTFPRIVGQSTPLIERFWEKDSPANLTQSVRIDGGVVSREKFGFHWESRIAPGTPPLADGFSTTTTDSMGVIHRVMLDRSGRTYFGYDVLVDVLPEANTYRVTFQPLVMTSALAGGLSMDRWSEWIPLSAPRFPPPQIVRGGEILAFTLLTNSGSGQKIVDYISVQEPQLKVSPFQNPPEERNFSYATGTPRDITSSDVEMSIKAPRLAVSGKLEETTTSQFGEVTGALVWLYVPKRGRFILSLAPHPEAGFVKAGEVRGSSLIFYVGSDSFALSSAGRIAPGQAAFNLYVLHQPNWKPTYLFADLSAFNMGVEDRIEPLLGK